MKDLKHYFSSPKECEIPIDQPDLTQKSTPVEKKKKKKRKREERELDSPVVTKKKRETPKVSLEKRKSPNSSKENSFEEASPESNNLLNYFAKVDKIPAMPSGHQVVVEALVHQPPDDGATKAALKTRLRIRRRPGKDPEYDIILNHDSPQTPIPTNTSDINVLSSVENQKEKVLEEDDQMVRAPPTPKNGKNKNKKSNGTLASFFKPSTSKETVKMSDERKEAVRLFLQSGLDTPKLLNKPKEVEGISAPYPKFSHVRQKDLMNIVWHMSSAECKLDKSQYLPPQMPSWSCITDRKHPPVFSPKKKPVNHKQALKALKKSKPQLPIAAWHKEIMRQKKTHQGEMWTEKYKLENSEMALANKKQIATLKKWFTSFKENGKTKEKIEVDSEDDFINSDSDCSQKTLKNIAVISGPVGAGKTASIYALAQEMGYEVLELNASCNRSGKKIHKDLSEALQSHNANVISLVSTKKKKVNAEKKRSLILIEDADLLFNNTDEGYSQTIVSLAMNSKRPIIFVVNDLGTKYLGKLKPHVELELEFKLVNESVLVAWLQVVSIAEEMDIDQDQLEKSLHSDIRRSLLNLQFFASNPQTSFSDGRKLNNTWNALGKCNLSCSNLVKDTVRLTNILCRSDCLSFSSDELEDPLIPSLKSRLKYSTSLDHPEEYSNNLSQEIASHTSELLHRIAGIDDPHTSQNFRTDFVDAVDCTATDLLTPSAQLSMGQVCLDYMPYVRAMARLEKTRLQTQSKRTNRFNHYLNFIGLKRSSAAILDTMCTGLAPD